MLKSGVTGEMAEQPFVSTTAGEMPAGSLIFPANGRGDLHGIIAQRRDGRSAGRRWQGLRHAGRARPASALPQTTKVAEAPKVAILVMSVPNPASIQLAPTQPAC